MRIFPESALVQLEFDKIKTLLAEQCNTEYARAKAEDLRIHTRREFIELELQQSNEFKLLNQNGQYFPNDDTLNLARELKLLGIPGATLSGERDVQSVRIEEARGDATQIRFSHQVPSAALANDEAARFKLASS